MAAVCWSLDTTRTLLRFDGSEEDATRAKERGRERKRTMRVGVRGRRRKQKNEEKRQREARVIPRTDEKRDDEDGEQEMNNAWGRRGNTWKGEQGVRAATRRRHRRWQRDEEG